MLISYNTNFSKLPILNLIIVISLFVNSCDSFLYSRNGNISQLPLTHQFKTKNFEPKFKCSTDSTNYIDKIAYNKPENVIGLLCNFEKRIEIVRSIYDSISQGKSRFSSLFYITNSHDDLINVHNAISKGLNNDSENFNGVNIICNEYVKLYKNATITLSDCYTLSECLNNFGGIDWGKKALTLNGGLVKGRAIGSFKRTLLAVLESFFINPNHFTNSLSDKDLRIHLDDEFLAPANDFIDSNFKTVEQFVNFFNPQNAENLLENHDKLEETPEIKSNNEKLVIINNFSVNYDLKNGKLNCSLYDDLILRLGPNCTFLGLSSAIYNVNNVVNWLNSLSKPTKVITLSKVPTFNILTQYGQINPFNTNNTNITNATTINTNNSTINPVNTNDLVGNNNSVNTNDSVDTGDSVENMRDPKKLHDMFKKKNNKTKLSNLNPFLDELVTRSLIDALESRGIRTYNQLVTVVPSARNFFKRYLRILRLSPSYLDSKNRLYNLFKLIINVRENKFLSKFIQKFDLYPVIKQMHNPSPRVLVDYIRQKGLFPTVIYCFNDTERVKRTFYNYFSSLNCGGMGNFPQSEVNFDGSVVNPLNDIMISNKKIEGARHYIFLDTMIMEAQKRFTLSNESLYTLTAGSELVTFTVDLHTLFHNIKSLIAPIYLNYSHLNNDNHCLVSNTSQPVVSNTSQPVVSNTTQPVVSHDTNPVNTINTSNGFNSSNMVYNGKFERYLKGCKEKYERMFPDYFGLRESFDSLENRLKAMNIDTFKLTQINSCLTKTRKFFKTMAKSLISKLNLRGKFVIKFVKSLPKTVFIIQGVDNQEYSTVPNSCDLVSKFVTNEIKGSGNEHPFILLKNVNTGNYIITNCLFLKDIISIREPNPQDSVNVEDILKDLTSTKVDTITDNNIKVRTIKVENDLKDYMNGKDIVIRVIGNDEVKVQKLSSVLPKFLMNIINKHIDNYNERLKSLIDLINNSNTSNITNNCSKGEGATEVPNNVGEGATIESAAKVEGATNTANNSSKVNNNVVIGNKVMDGVMKLVDEYLNLNKMNKRRNLEVVIRNHQFKNAFYGKT